MKNNLLLLSLAVIALLYACEQATIKQELVIEQVEAKWVSDSRVDVFDVELVYSQDALVVKGETTIPQAKDELLLKLEQSNKLVDSLVVLPSSSIEKKWAITTLSIANLRDEPRHSAQLVSQTIMGTPVRILKQEGGWSLVQSPDRYIAWTNNSSLAFIDEAEFNAWRSGRRVFVLCDGWLEDGFGHHVSDLVKGSLLTVVEKQKDKVLLSLPDGRSGTVGADVVREFEMAGALPTLESQDLIEVSKEFMGLPYLWGGTSSKAVDCSGFLKNIYFLNGYILARDASQQIKYGQPITLQVEALQVGDLLFFGDAESKKVTHVGMYIGDTEFIHSSGCVKVNSLDETRDNYSGYRKASWLGAQRYIGHAPGDGLMPVNQHPWYVNHK
ncbi:C40 family peptidase [Carboxylicivirga sediminis]|uniref:C40 family peptidase n=1 Tax=Carboxylicivirga sediminis TaxID=2006564 RepID=A0A941EZG7_9BACT|nr:C40 family peptidase [Carboxylicivirga sediminis]MBR8533992.1 C40 family peptidase [Carboxylicivirga sediminis]